MADKQQRIQQLKRRRERLTEAIVDKSPETWAKREIARVDWEIAKLKGGK